MGQKQMSLFTKLATRNAQEGAAAEGAAASTTVQTVLRVKRKRCDEAAEVFPLDEQSESSKRPNLADMMAESSLSKAAAEEPAAARKVFRRVKSGTHADNIVKRCVKAQSAGVTKESNQAHRKESELERRKSERTAQLRSSRYTQCGENVSQEDSVRFIDIEPTVSNQTESKQKRKDRGDVSVQDDAILCNDSTMVRTKLNKPDAAEEEEEWVYDFYVVDEQPCTSADLDGAEVLTIAYFDENGELVCEDAVDSDDDLQGDGVVDEDAQEWDYPDEGDDEVDSDDEDGRQWCFGGDEGGGGEMLSSDGDDLDIYSSAMYKDKEQYNASPYDDFKD